MNITELARIVKIPTARLKAILPELGFHIGSRAIKVDDRVAQQIIKKLSQTEVKSKYLGKPVVASRLVTKTDQLAARRSQELSLPETITVRDFAAKLDLPVTRVIVELMKNGIMAAQNERIDYETAAIIAQDFGKKTKLISTPEGTSIIDSSPAAKLQAEEDDELRPRPPVVVIMGHVDHGKTKLLDTIRRTNLIEQESGGITQHIGAYQVVVSSSATQELAATTPAVGSDQTKAENRTITFIDTPGHEAFVSMRSRGAWVADIAILVVAADDGVQPQTIEALTHIRKSQLPFIVALNKIDKPEANTDKVKKELAELQVVPEEWGGEVPFVNISAKVGTGIDDLLELILLVAEMNQDKIQANPDRLAVGSIIESHIDPGQGPLATVLIHTGTLKVGDYIVVGNSYGKIRAMRNHLKKLVNQAAPAEPVQILGLRTVPRVGELLSAVESLRTAKQKIKLNRQRLLVKLPKQVKQTGQEKEDQTKEASPQVNLILRTDVLGSQEAILEAMSDIQEETVKLNIIHQGLGNVTEADVVKASDSGAVILAFNVQVVQSVWELAKQKRVTIAASKVIYNLLDQVKKLVKEKRLTEVIRTEVGRLRVNALFRQAKDFLIIGGKVESGKVMKGYPCQIVRVEELVGETKVAELQSGRTPVNEVSEGAEAGLKISPVVDVVVGDLLISFSETLKND